jgi:hypothetical protein
MLWIGLVARKNSEQNISRAIKNRVVKPGQYYFLNWTTPARRH